MVVWMRWFLKSSWMSRDCWLDPKNQKLSRNLQRKIFVTREFGRHLRHSFGRSLSHSLFPLLLLLMRNPFHWSCHLSANSATHRSFALPFSSILHFRSTFDRCFLDNISPQDHSVTSAIHLLISLTFDPCQPWHHQLATFWYLKRKCRWDSYSEVDGQTRHLTHWRFCILLPTCQLSRNS